MSSRIRFICISTVICFSLIISRLFYIQIYQGAEYKEMAEKQTSKEIVLNTGRGAILDGNGVPFTGRKVSNKVIAVPAQITDKKLAAGVVSKLSGRDNVERILEESGDDILTFDVKDKELLKMIQDSLPHGVYIYHDKQRYTQNSLAQHIIGYINKNGTGMMGIEKDFDQDLGSSSKKVLRVYKDGSNRILPGMDAEFVNTGDDEGFNIRTTLNYSIQKATESAMDKFKVNGAVVIMDSSTGDVLAIASRPKFNQNNINTSLKKTDAPLINRAVNGYPPGSVFKTVVAAAAIEEGKVGPDDKFHCNGSIKVNNVTYDCYNKEEHGNINFEEAYAKSCNVAFIETGRRVGGEKILEMAKRFGFGEPEHIGININQNVHLPQENETTGAGIGNLSIGQGSLLVSPLQVADMTSVIANGGYRCKPRLVDAIVDDNGKVLRKVTKGEGYQVIEPEVAQNLCKMMRLAVSEGTGKNADVDGIVSGKTGTAEFNKGENISHSWFTGFFPYKKSNCVITVIAEGGGVGGKKAAEMFHYIAENIIKIS